MPQLFDTSVNHVNILCDWRWFLEDWSRLSAEAALR